MTVPGVDFAWSRPSVAALKKAGEVFVVRYLSRDPSKNLTRAEADAYQAAGIAVCANWEYDATAMKGGHSQGVADARAALSQATTCGLPHIPVYFSCDWDATPGDQAAINGYLDGCASVIGASRVGMYGGFWPLSRARADGKARYTWGTIAWSGSNWATAGWVPDIMQGPFVNVGGVTCDLDAAHSQDFGQWPRPAGPVKTWQTLTTDGTTSLQQVADVVGMSPSKILRVTATHYKRFDDVTAGWLNGVFAGTVPVSDPVPAGAQLRVLQ